MTVSFKQRVVDVSFTLAAGTFPEGNDTITLRQLRISAHVSKAGAAALNSLDMQVFGMTLEQMNKLTTQGQTYTAKQKNIVTVKAGDTDGQLSTVFSGMIHDAWGDFGGAPQVGFRVAASGGLAQALDKPDPVSFQGGADIQTILQKLAKQGGLEFEGNGVHKKLADQYLTGSTREQIQTAANAAGVEWIIDDNKLIIWDSGSARQGDSVTISKDMGMIGYPAYTSYGLLVQTLFDPAIRFGGAVHVDSTLVGATGDWVVHGLDYDLEANTPGGQWKATVALAAKGFPTIPSRSGL